MLHNIRAGGDEFVAFGRETKKLLGVAFESPWILAGLAILAVPEARKALRPLAIAGVRAVMGVAESARRSMGSAQEAVEDIVAEAQFQRLESRADDGVASVSGAIAGAAATAYHRVSEVVNEAAQGAQDAVQEVLDGGSDQPQ